MMKLKMFAIAAQGGPLYILDLIERSDRVPFEAYALFVAVFSLLSLFPISVDHFLRSFLSVFKNLLNYNILLKVSIVTLKGTLKQAKNSVKEWYNLFLVFISTVFCFDFFFTYFNNL